MNKKGKKGKWEEKMGNGEKKGKWGEKRGNGEKKGKWGEKRLSKKENILKYIYLLKDQLSPCIKGKLAYTTISEKMNKKEKKEKNREERKIRRRQEDERRRKE